MLPLRRVVQFINDSKCEGPVRGMGKGSRSKPFPGAKQEMYLGKAENIIQSPKIGQTKGRSKIIVGENTGKKSKLENPKYTKNMNYEKYKK